MSIANNAAKNDIGSWLRSLLVRNIYCASVPVEITHKYDGNNRKYHKSSTLPLHFFSLLCRFFALPCSFFGLNA